MSVRYVWDYIVWWVSVISNLAICWIVVYIFVFVLSQTRTCRCPTDCMILILAQPTTNVITIMSLPPLLALCYYYYNIYPIFIFHNITGVCNRSQLTKHVKRAGGGVFMEWSQSTFLWQHAPFLNCRLQKLSWVLPHQNDYYHHTHLGFICECSSSTLCDTTFFILFLLRRPYL